MVKVDFSPCLDEFSLSEILSLPLFKLLLLLFKLYLNPPCNHLKNLGEISEGLDFANPVFQRDCKESLGDCL